MKKYIGFALLALSALVGFSSCAVQRQHGQTQLMKAVETGDVMAARRILSAGTEVDAVSNNGETALMVACRQYMSEPIVRDLISYGADVNAKSKFGLTPLMIAKQSGRVELVEILKAHGAQE